MQNRLQESRVLLHQLAQVLDLWLVLKRRQVEGAARGDAALLTCGTGTDACTATGVGLLLLGSNG